MLPTLTDIGARLAAVAPAGLACLARQRESENQGAAVLGGPATSPWNTSLDAFVLIVVDGLGWHALHDRGGHAPNLSRLARESANPIQTVVPSTTGAALTSIVTGVLPGEHGLVGYRIRHPRLGLVTTLSQWQHIQVADEWQTATPVFARARQAGIPSYAIGRSAQEGSGLSRAILGGASYVARDRMEQRFQVAGELVRRGGFVYLYVDELDRVGHRDGWRGESWTNALERLDRQLGEFLRGIPQGVGVALTADHGMLDCDARKHLLLDGDADVAPLMREFELVGGEPRLRYLYLRAGGDVAARAVQLGERVQRALGERAWVFTRDEACAAGFYGSLRDGVADRIGDVIVAARGENCFYTGTDDALSRQMRGQHGSFTAQERDVPLFFAGALAGAAI